MEIGGIAAVSFLDLMGERSSPAHRKAELFRTSIVMNQVIVVPHDPNWREAFESEASHVAVALGENIVAIHHIGSTAIPNIFAKPVIDSLVEVKDISLVDDPHRAINIPYAKLNVDKNLF